VTQDIQVSQRLTDAPIARVFHTAAVIAILVVWAAWGKIGLDHTRAAGNPNRMRIYLLTVAFEWILFFIVAGGASFEVVTGKKWDGIRAALQDAGIALAFWIIASILLASGARLLHIPPQLRNVRFLLPRTIGELVAWVALSVTAGICEEGIFRGYLQVQLRALTKSTVAGLVLSAVLFGFGHAYQGWGAAGLLAFYGLLFGLLTHWRGTVRPAMIAHAWQDSFTGIVGAALLRRLSS
jgi:membrane protease YdiL (CAAX protease family)